MNRLEDGTHPDLLTSSAIAYLTRTVWESRTIVFAFIGAFALIAILVGELSKPIYEAQVTAYPANDASGNGSGLAGIVAQLGFGQGQMNPMDITPPVPETLALLQSRQLTLNFIHRHKLLPELFPDRWDSKRRAWKGPGTIARFFSSLSGHPSRIAPSDDDAFALFDRIRSVSFDTKSGVITVSISWHNPQQAADWANWLVKDTDQSLRIRALEDSQNGLDFLEREGVKAKLSNLTSSINSVASMEVTRGMLANVRPNFAIKILDPATPPQHPSWPKTGFLLIVSLLGGAFFGSLAAIVWQYVRQSMFRGRIRASAALALWPRRGRREADSGPKNMVAD